MKNMYRNMVILAIILALLFTPTSCNGVTYFNGIRGCSTGNNSDSDNDGHGSALMGLINW